MLSRKLKFCYEMIVKAKEKHIRKIGEKLDAREAFTNSYWPIVNSFLSNMKIPNIPPLKVNDVLVSDFTVKVEPFKSYFAAQV